MGLIHNPVPAEHQDLFGVRTDTPYTGAEREYSAALQNCLEELLEGRRSEMVLLRRHHGARPRIEVPPAPPAIDRTELRGRVVERLLVATISFVRDVSPGGPVFQREVDGRIVETQHFSTKYPHINIERLDAFEADTRFPLFTEWRLRRTQNHRQEFQINRWLDAANLTISLVKSLTGRG